MDILTPTMHAVVEYKKKLMYIPNIAWTESKETGVQDVIHLDKKLVRPGETLHVIGMVAHAAMTICLLVLDACRNALLLPLHLVSYLLWHI